MIKKRPLPVTVDDNRITVYAEFHPLLLAKAKDCGLTYADICENGIKKYWTEGGFEVDFIRVDKDDKRPHIKILPAKMTGTSYVMSRWWRWCWGLFLTIHPEAFMLNWSPRHPGNIHLNLKTYSGPKWFMRVSAHEFGHILGLGDAYGAPYRYFYEAPGTEDYMMNHNRQVSPVEAEMVKKAHKTGRMQYFPMKFKLKLVFAGIKKQYFRI